MAGNTASTAVRNNSTSEGEQLDKNTVTMKAGQSSSKVIYIRFSAKPLETYRAIPYF